MFFIRILSGEPPCPRCGTTTDDINHGGRLGCPHCYEHFAARLEPYLQRVYGAAVHTGDIPASAGEALRRERHKRSLREALQSAVAAEDFERCAVLRDEIKALEATGAVSEGGLPS